MVFSGIHMSKNNSRMGWGTGVKFGRMMKDVWSYHMHSSMSVHLSVCV